MPVLLYTPLSGDWILRQLIRHTGQTLDLDIDMEKARLSFPLQLSLHELKAQPRGKNDTLFAFRHLRAELDPFALVSGILSLDSLSLCDLRLSTGDFIEGLALQGTLGALSAQANIHLVNENVRIRTLSLWDASVSLRLDSILPKDTLSEPFRWTFEADRLRLRRIGFALRIPSDTLFLSVGMEEGEVRAIDANPDKVRYAAEQVRITEADLCYDVNDRPPGGGLDHSHLRFRKIHAFVDSVRYRGQSLSMRIESLTATERSGLEVLSLKGWIGSDSAQISAHELRLRTPWSFASLEATIPWNMEKETFGEGMRLALNASLGKNDLMLWEKALAPGLGNAFPDIPLLLTLRAEGGSSALYLKQLTAELPQGFVLSATGQAQRPSDSLRRSVRAHFNLQMHDMDFARNFLPDAQRERFRIPGGLRLSGDAGLDASEIFADLRLSEDSVDLVTLNIRYDSPSERYEARLELDRLSPVRFLPGDSLVRLSALLHAEGKGTDVFADSTVGNLRAHLSDLQYASTGIRDLVIRASLKDHNASLDLRSAYPPAQMDLQFNGSLRNNRLQGVWIGNIDTLDLRQLHLMDRPLATSFQLFAETETDFGVNHTADLTLGNWELNIADRYLRPKMLTLHARTDTDTTRLSMHVGDFGIVATGNTDVKILSEKLSSLNMDSLWRMLPDMTLRVDVGKDNPVYSLLREYDIDFDALHLNASSSPRNGLHLDAALHTLYIDTFRIDTLGASIRPDPEGLNYKLWVVKHSYRQQEPFTASVAGALRNRYADAEFLYANSRGEPGFHLGVRVDQQAEGVLLGFFPENPVVAFNTFGLNPDNYIRFRNKNDIAAELRLQGENNSLLRLHSHSLEGDFRELHAELNRINLQLVSEGFPNMPAMRGMMSANLRYAPSEESFLVAGDAHIDNLVYEGNEAGELLLNGVYLPTGEGMHQVDAHFYHNRKERVSATAVYETTRERIGGTLRMDTLPLRLLTPLIPDKTVALQGAMHGTVTVDGAIKAPLVNGYLQMDTASVYTEATASRFFMDSKRIEIRANRLLLDSFKVYPAGRNPLVVHGEVNFTDPEHIVADLQLKGRNLQALDVKRNPESWVYGKLLLHVDATVKGDPRALSLRGDLQLLGGTNLTYVMKESPLTVRDRLKDLITFTSFADTLPPRQRRPGSFIPAPRTGMDVLMRLRIDPIVQLGADLTPDRSSYVSIEGGGDLSLQYNQRGDVQLNGRYTLSDGRLKYALPVIPLKEFAVKNNSYLQWDGNPMNPLLNLDATQRMRTSVSLDGETPRMVNFDVGVSLRRRLEDMALTFTIAAPEDKSVQEDLDRMGAEGRSTQAVAMMATGLYLSGGNSGKVNLDMGNALGSFLQHEINNLTGEALNSVDFSIGMNTYNNADTESGQRTDYSFRFAKRFYKDRIRVVIGGKVSTGDVRQKESFIDNASLEWRLNPSGTGYLKLFHDKNYQSILDGEVTETGLGLVFRRRMRHWYELFQ
jgi:hypothetical protein